MLLPPAQTYRRTQPVSLAQLFKWPWSFSTFIPQPGRRIQSGTPTGVGLSVLKSHFARACIGLFKLYRLCERRFVRTIDLQKGFSLSEAVDDGAGKETSSAAAAVPCSRSGQPIAGGAGRGANSAWRRRRSYTLWSTRALPS
jgi:hypothetical protein